MILVKSACCTHERMYRGRARYRKYTVGSESIIFVKFAETCVDSKKQLDRQIFAKSSVSVTSILTVKFYEFQFFSRSSKKTRSLH